MIMRNNNRRRLKETERTKVINVKERKRARGSREINKMVNKVREGKIFSIFFALRIFPLCRGVRVFMNSDTCSTSHASHCMCAAPVCCELTNEYMSFASPLAGASLCPFQAFTPSPPLPFRS